MGKRSPRIYFNVWFEGKLVEGYGPDDVVRDLMALYQGRINFTKILFSGKPVLVEEETSHERAVQILKAYESAGAVCWIGFVDIVDLEMEDVQLYKKVIDKSYISLPGLFSNALKS